MMHMRKHRSLLAAAEKRLLIAIAHRLPGWVRSDHLTILGLLSMPAAGLAFASLQLSPFAQKTIVRAPFAPFPRSLGCGAIATGHPCNDTLSSTNMRLRLEPTFNIDEGTSVHVQADVYDNLTDMRGMPPERQAHSLQRAVQYMKVLHTLEAPQAQRPLQLVQELLRKMRGGAP